MDNDNRCIFAQQFVRKVRIMINVDRVETKNKH